MLYRPLLYLEGAKAEDEYAKTKKLPDPKTTDNLEFQIVKKLLAESIQQDPQKFTRMAKHCKGVSEETTTGK